MEVAEQQSQAHTFRQDDRLVMVLSGNWKLAHGLRNFASLLEGQAPSEDIRAIVFDASALGDWDSSLLTFLLQGVDVCQAQGIAFRDDELPENLRKLIALARAVPEKETHAAAGKASFVEAAGQRALVTGEGLRSTAEFIGESVLSVGRLLTGRSRMRWSEFWAVVQTTGPGALPVVTLISALIGFILAFLGAVVLQSFGAEIYSAYIVGFGMLRELGPLMTGIIMVGRTGAAFAAEIGSMKVSEEIDAYQTMGVPPMDYLVLPRLLALFLMMPLLTVYSDIIGVMSGMVISTAMMDINPQLFLGTLLDAVGLPDFLIEVFKGTIFGGIIALSGCMRGMQCGRSADAVGAATTSAVVTGITLIILSNAVIDWLATLL